MDLPSKNVIDILADKGVTEIHHANSVLTSTQFLRSASLLSRGLIERRKMFQTPQSSDDLDHRMSLWFDVFTDSVDIHARASNANFYGPVLFVLDIEKVKAMYKGRLWVTKLNPTKWDGVSNEERWFRSVKELEEGFSVGTFNQMIVFRHSGGELPIKSCLTKIILDDPRLKLENGLDVFSLAYGALMISMTEGRLNVPIEKRTCPDRCKCQQMYQDADFAAKMFLPLR